MSEPFIGEVRMVGFNFAPRGWAFCDGQLLPIAQNSALFSLLGTNFGGDGRTTFGVPDLRSRMAMGAGHGPGLTDRRLGERGGASLHWLSQAEMPAHDHALMATASPTSGNPSGKALAPSANGARAYRIPGATAAMAPSALAQTGSSQPHENRPPVLGIYFCIALMGTYPSRS